MSAADDMLWSVTLDLGLREPGEEPLPLEFDPHLGSMGKFIPRTGRIVIRGGMDAHETALTVAHELRHAWQYKNWTVEKLLSRALKEADAERYEREAVERFFREKRYGGRPAGALGIGPERIENRKLAA